MMTRRLPERKKVLRVDARPDDAPPREAPPASVPPPAETPLAETPLRREAGGEGPYLSEQWRMGTGTRLSVPPGAPRSLDDLPANLRKPSKPPSKLPSQPRLEDPDV